MIIMITKEFEYTLKDGRKALIRNPKVEDVPAVLEYLYKVTSETHFLMNYPEECSKYTPEGEKALFERVNASDDEVMLLCVIGGKPAGICEITFNKKIKTRHRAQIAIALLSEYWGQGIGTRLIQELIRLAEERDYVSQMELDFIEGNVRARALYEKMGFRIVATKPNAIRLKDGTLLNEYFMIKELKRD